MAFKKKVVVLRRSSSVNKAKPGSTTTRTTKTGRKYTVSVPKRNISVRVVSPTHNVFKQKALSPKTRTTKTGRKILVWNEVKAPSGFVYSIQPILPGTRKLMNK